MLSTALSISGVFAQSSDQTCRKAKRLIDRLEEYHVEPKTLDDSLSNEIFLNFTQLLDPNQLYFNQANMAELGEWRYQIDDFIKDKDCTFLDSVLIAYEQRVAKAQEILDSFEAKEFDFNKEDTLNFSYADLPDARSENRNLRGTWEHRIKYSILSQIWPGTLSDEAVEKAFDEIKMERLENLKPLLENRDELASNIQYKLLKAIAKSYDPHTTYFSFGDKEDFDASISNQEFTYGLELSNDAAGNVMVARLVPGSYAWQSNKIHDGDILIKMKVATGKEIDVSNYNAHDLEDLLLEYDSKIQFTIRKTNGSIQKVTLEKQKVDTDENIVKSLIIDGPNKIAYISLPSFYSKEYGGNSGCSSDLASEILMLKKENIDGVIIDLRNNGGGSMMEAVALSGIFVDGGAISIKKEGEERAYTLKDPNRGTLYSGPLVVMVNGSSASASELFSAAIQDHNRGILVGGSTYGKATGQAILPIDNDLEDFIKVTTLKFYRVTGETHQKFGIQPDIKLPGMTESLGRSEKSYYNALNAQRINKKTYYTRLEELPISALAKKSAERIEKNTSFDSLLIEQDIQNQYLSHGKLLIPLSLQGYEQFNKDLFGETETSTPDVWGEIEIKLSDKDKEISGIDSYGSATYRILTEDLQRDLHLREAYEIIGDYIELKKN